MQCKTCQVDKTEDQFRKFKQDGRTYLRKSCKLCQSKNTLAWQKENDTKEYRKRKAIAAKEWRAANPERHKRNSRRKWWKDAGINPDLAEAYFKSHNGLCDLCHEPAFNNRAMHMDHDHTTGKIRGMLHSQCNSLLGMARDSPRILILAIEYLNKSQ